MHPSAIILKLSKVFFLTLGLIIFFFIILFFAIFKNEGREELDPVKIVP